MRGENLRQRVKKDFYDVCLQLRGGGVKHQKSFSNTKMNDRERERERKSKEDSKESYNNGTERKKERRKN